jgi:hypothetical protein
MTHDNSTVSPDQAYDGAVPLSARRLEQFDSYEVYNLHFFHAAEHNFSVRCRELVRVIAAWRMGDASPYDGAIMMRLLNALGVSLRRSRDGAVRAYEAALGFMSDK